MLAILAPGQGAQRQELLTPWLTDDAVGDNLQLLSDAAGIDLLAAGTVMSDAEITDTAIAQPLIVAASLITAAALPTLPRDTVYAGHSVGEFAAAALAGAMAPADAVRLVATRGAAMARSSAAPAGGMTALLGGDAAEVLAAIAAAGASVANYNATGQIVAAGTAESLARLAENPPARARLRPLAVAGAFHTELMAPAQDEIAAAAATVAVTSSRTGVVSNADGTLLTDGAEILARLVSQVCRPVRWDLCMQTLSSMGVTATIELAPAGTLTALIKRELPHIATLALKDPADLEAAAELINDRSAELTCESMPWQLLVAPARGTVNVADASTDVSIAAGDVVVRVSTRTEDLEVRTAQAGHLLEWLVQDGDPVNEGQPLVRLSTEVMA